jgi:hypothetical protein
MDFHAAGLGVALPVLIAPGGVATEEVLYIVNSLNRFRFSYRLTTHPSWLEGIRSQSIDFPNELDMQFIPCQTFDELCEIADRLREPTAPFFMRNFLRIIVIDYPANPNIQAIRSEYDSLAESDFQGFLYHHSTEALLPCFNETTSLTFDSSSIENVHEYIYRLVESLAVRACLRIFTIGFADATVRRSCLLLLSCNRRHAIEAINCFLARRSPVFTAELFETAAILAHFHGAKIDAIPSFSGVFPNPGDDESIDITYLSIAASLFLQFQLPGRAIDCAIRAVFFRRTQLIAYVVGLIQEHFRVSGVKFRALEFLAVCKELLLCRKACFYAQLFAKTFQHPDQVEFQLATLRLLEQVAQRKAQLRN